MPAPLLTVAAFLLLALPARAETISVPPFTFRVPAGWTNLSPNAPPENFRGLPPQVVQQVQQTSGAAMDLNGAADGFAENLNVILVRCPGPFTETAVASLARQAPQAIAAQAPGSSASVREQGVARIGGVAAGRLVMDVTLGALQLRQVQYHFPAGEKCAVVTYSTTPAAFDRYLPVFEAAARATTGLSEPPASTFWSRVGASALRGALIGGLAGGAAALLVALLRRKRKKP